MVAARSTAELSQLVERHRIIVCAGSGGVGKTTTAAALALWGALCGRRAIVLTIDPARRLADSLGVGPIGNTPVEVPREVLANLGREVRGSLSAMMLDQKGSWDELVERHAPSPEVRERILENRFYRQLSQSFAGSQEYMAVEQLGELEASGRYDLIVVDTPPTQHALDFLEAPERLLAFLDRKIVKWFVKPSFSAGWSTLRTMNRTVGFLLHKIEDATGVSALADVTDFFGAMGGLFEDFEPRVQRVTQLLRQPETAFLLVAGPDEQVLDQAEYLAGQMAARGMPLKGVVMNRVHPLVVHDGIADSVEAVTALLEEVLSGEPQKSPAPPLESTRRSGKAPAPAARRASLAERLARNFVAYQTRARGDAVRMEIFRQALPRGVPLVQVPNLTGDVHDLSGLLLLHPHLFGARA
ncbi:MAG TPA: ArsA-related P-loop ATPase [Candidatus Binatia bacterium]